MEALIEARGLTKVFKKTTALDGLDLTIAANQTVAILGPNGAGKTTFIRTVATLLRPDRGTLSVAGLDIAHSPMAIRRLIGLAGQSAAVEASMTGRENLVMVARLYGQNARTAKASAKPRSSSWSRSARRPTAPSRRTRGACAAASTWGPAWSAVPDCSCWTRRPPASIRAAAASSCGTPSGTWDSRVPSILLTTQYPRRGGSTRRFHRHHRRRPGHRPGHARRAQVEAESRTHDRAAHPRRRQPARPPPPSWPRTGTEANRPSSAPPGARWPQPGRAQLLPAVVRALDDAAITVEDITLRRPTLDEVFLALTGHTATDTATDKEQAA